MYAMFPAFSLTYNSNMLPNENEIRRQTLKTNQLVGFCVFVKIVWSAFTHLFTFI